MAAEDGFDSVVAADDDGLELAFAEGEAEFVEVVFFGVAWVLAQVVQGELRVFEVVHVVPPVEGLGATECRGKRLVGV